MTIETMRGTDPIRVGELLAERYLVLRRIGDGGMGVVYEGKDLALARSVAIKAPHRWLAASPDVRDSFLREARSAVLVGHPGVVSVLDIGWTDDGVRFLVMEYVEGESLVDRISERAPLPIHEACAIAVELLEVLEAAHLRGVVHRDLKPENVHLSPLPDGTERVKVLDFGLARLSAELANDPVEQTVAGTPAYMSPERALGQPGDHRSDLWSVGVMLHEMLTGELPFDGGTAEVLHRIASEDAPLLRSVAPSMPRGLEAVLARALAREPEDRPASAAALAAALSPFTPEEAARPRRIRASRPSARGRESTAPVSTAWRPGLVASMGTIGIVAALLWAGPDTTQRWAARSATALTAGFDLAHVDMPVVVPGGAHLARATARVSVTPFERAAKAARTQIASQRRLRRVRLAYGQRFDPGVLYGGPPADGPAVIDQSEDAIR